MTISEIAERLKHYDFHTCAVCLRRVNRGHINGREGNGVSMTVWCHGMKSTGVVPDSVTEDSKHVWWFDTDPGVPYESAGARRKRELGEELARVRAARIRHG